MEVNSNMKTFISFICEDETTAIKNLKALDGWFGIERISRIMGNELLVEVTKAHHINAGLKEIRNKLVFPARVDMFDAYPDGSRYWYGLC